MSRQQPIEDSQHELEPLPFSQLEVWRYHLTKSQRVIWHQDCQAIDIIPIGEIDASAIGKCRFCELLYHARIEMHDMTHRTRD